MSAAARYLKKPIAVDAIQWTGSNFGELLEFVGPVIDPPLMDEEDPGIVWIWVEKSNARCAVVAAGWVIAEPDGVGYYPCTEEQFSVAYIEMPERSEPDPPELLNRRIDALVDERFVRAGWRLVTTAGHVVLRPDVERPSQWGGRGHRIYVRRSGSEESM